MGETEHLERQSSRALIFLVLRSMVAFMSRFSCLTSLKSLFSPVTTDFRLFHLKLVEEHADSDITQRADESVRTALIGRMVRRIRDGVVAVVSGDRRAGGDDSCRV